LLAEVGRDDRSDARLWHGRDTVLERDVALTLFVSHSADTAAAGRTRAAVARAMRSARLQTSGAARVLDVLEPEPGPGPAVAAVVAEWTPGRNLVDVVHDGLAPPAAVAGMLVPLARAVDAAHRAGLVLGCDHPERVRVTPQGHARLAFPGPPSDTTAADDVLGLGAALYALLTGHWPLGDGPTALPAAPQEPDGTPVTARTLRPTVPPALSTLAARSLAAGGEGGVHTAAAVAQVLEHNAAEAGELLAGDGARGSLWHGPDEDPPQSPEQRVRLQIGVTTLVVASLVILGWFGGQVVSVLTGETSGPPPVVVDEQPPDAAAPDTPAPDVPAAAPAAAGPVAVDGVTVYDISGNGDPDNAEDADLVIDGDPGSAWSTDNYFEPFPAFKPGLGLMLSLERPVTAGSLVVDSPSQGTRVEVRAAPSPDAELDETTVIATATLDEGRTTIPLRSGEPRQYLLVWITELATPDGGNRSAVGELTVLRAPTS
jgi:hypothetical protein